VNDGAVVLHPVSTNKLYSRWEIGTAAELLSPYGYLTRLTDRGATYTR